MYGESSCKSPDFLKTHNGANVFIRNSNKKWADYKTGDVVIAKHVDRGEAEFPGIIIAHLQDVFEVADTDGNGLMIKSVYYHTNFMVYSRRQMNEN